MSATNDPSIQIPPEASNIVSGKYEISTETVRHMGYRHSVGQHWACGETPAAARAACLALVNEAKGRAPLHRQTPFGPPRRKSYR